MTLVTLHWPNCLTVSPMAAQARPGLVVTGLGLSVMSWSGMMSLLMTKVMTFLVGVMLIGPATRTFLSFLPVFCDVSSSAFDGELSAQFTLFLCCAL